VTSPSRKTQVHRRMSRTIGLNVRGRQDSEVHRVCEDVYKIVEKMLSANKTIRPFSRHPRFEFEEVLFLLAFLEAPGRNTAEGCDDSNVDLWISGD